MLPDHRTSEVDVHHRRRERRCPPIPALGRQLGLGVIAALIMQSLDNQEQIMANFDALNDAVAGIGTALDEAVTRIDEDVQALKDQLESDATDQAAVDELTAKVEASVERLKAIDPDPNSPAAPVEPTEPTDG